MTTSYKEAFGIVSLETDPQTDINADAKCWHPASNEWVDCPGSTGMGVDVLWSVDYTQIPAASVPEMQQRCRDLSNVRRRGDTENWPPRRPLRHETGLGRVRRVRRQARRRLEGQGRVVGEGLNAEGGDNAVVDAADADGGVGQVDHGVAAAVEGGQCGAHRDGLTGADLAGDHADAAFGDAPADARDRLAVGAVAVQHARCRSRPNGMREKP